MQPVSRDVQANDPKPGNARADIDPSGVFAALDKVIAETPLATRLRTEGAPAASALERLDSRDPAGVFAAIDKVVTETPLATRLRKEGTPAAPTIKRFDSEGPQQPVRSSQVPSAPVDALVASGSVTSASPSARISGIGEAG